MNEQLLKTSGADVLSSRKTQENLTPPLPLPCTHDLLQAVEWSIQKFVGPGLQVYGLQTTPLTALFYLLAARESYYHCVNDAFYFKKNVFFNLFIYPLLNDLKKRQKS